MSAELTAAQHARLDSMPPQARVVGLDRDCPLVEHGGGRIVRIKPDGRTVVAPRVVVEDVELRRAYGP